MDNKNKENLKNLIEEVFKGSIGLETKELIYHLVVKRNQGPKS